MTKAQIPMEEMLSTDRLLFGIWSLDIPRFRPMPESCNSPLANPLPAGILPCVDRSGSPRNGAVIGVLGFVF
jgi:hypothetical protein